MNTGRDWRKNEKMVRWVLGDKALFMSDNVLSDANKMQEILKAWEIEIAKALETALKRERIKC